jgi:lipoprotein
MKNFKKKFLSAMLACLMLSPCAAGFAACDNGGNGGGNGENTEPTYGDWQFNDTEHWRERTVYDEEERGEHTYGTDGYTCTVCGYENEAKKPAQKQNAADVFGGMKVSYAREKIADADGTAKSFNEILDRQFDLLAQDILYRLTYVYGYNQTTHNRTQNAKFTLKNGENDFSYQGNNAVVNSNTLLAAQQESVTKLTSVNIADINDFQKGVIVLVTNNYLYSPDNLNLAGAIEGRNARIIVSSRRYLLDEQTSTNAWSWYQDGASTYSEFSTKNNIDKMKMAIAQVAANKAADGSYSEAAYNTALAEIGALGFDGFDNAKLVKFIKSNVIGDSLVNKDDEYASTIKTEYNGIIDDNSLVEIDGETTFTSNIATDSPRLYKGYSMVLPAIVSQAIGNTFENTAQKIYPAMNRSAVKSSENLNAFANAAQAYESIVLMPKTEISATKLALKIKGANNIGVKCEINGEAVQVTASNDGELLLIDLHAYTKKIGAYNGGKENDFSNNLFGNSGAGAAGINNGAHYIKLIFENPTGGKFSVEIDGYYNK